MAQVIGVRTTNQVITETRQVRRVDDQIAMLEPNENPLLTFTMKLKKRKGIDSPRYEWFEDDYVARWTTNSATTVNANSGSTTVTVNDGTLFVAGDLFLVPNADSSSTAPELVRVTAVSTNTLTVVRAQGGTSVAAINAGAALRIVGNAYEEGAVTPSAKTTAPVAKISYTQIFRSSLNFTKTQVATKAYGAPDGERKREQRKKLIEQKEKMNAAFLFGSASESLTGGPTGAPVRTTMGLNSVISTNITDAGGVLTKKTFETFSRSAFRYGSREKLLLASPMVISAIHDWGNSFLLVKPLEKVYGVDVNRVQTGHGTWMLARDWMLEKGISGGNGFSGYAYSVDMDSLEYFFLNANGENRDTHLIQNAIQDGRDAFVDEYLTEAGLRIIQEKRFAKLFDVTDYSS